MNKRLFRTFAAVIFTLFLSVSEVTHAAQNYTLQVAQGWNLLGNATNGSMVVSSNTVFGDSNLVTSVWKWDASNSMWWFYSPSMTAAELQAYATAKNYKVLSEIKANEGYWVNAKTAFTRTFEFDSSALPTLIPGWNLISLFNNESPKDVIANPDYLTGQTSVVINTVWAWDNSMSKWYFYAPSLETNGQLDSYILDRSYLGFSQTNKLLGNGVGFWINAAAVPIGTKPPTVNISLSATKTSVDKPVTLTWSSTNATSCTGLDSMVAGIQPTTGSMTIAPTVGGQFTYTISCNGAGGTAKNGALLIVPIPVLKSSYENKMAAGKVLGPQPRKGDATVYADFLQDGSYSMVTMTLEYDPAKPISQASPGHVHFFQKVNGTWTDITSKLLTNTIGCIHPRKAMVADINGDGKPDVVFACHGYDSSPFPGEEQHVLLSQTDGTYKNVTLPITAYAHGGSVADVNGNGYANIVYTDTSIRREPFYLVNNKDGTFTEDPTRIPQSLKYFICFTDYKCGHGIYSLEFINFNNVNRYDMWVGGIYDPSDLGTITPTVYYSDGSNGFNDTQKLVIVPQTTKIVTLDIVFEGGKLYTLYETGNYTGVGIDKFDVAASTSQLFYSHTSNYPINGPWFPWIILFNGNIVASDAAFRVLVPQ